MSVIVKGMNMPENCIKCRMLFDGWCYVSPPDIDERVAPTVEDAWEQGKPEWCPLEEVIHCRDCKHYSSTQKWCYLWHGITREDGFCSFAEGKT